ncbi:hypothetical protein CHH28_11160 [Bacterioplanes sanyensis]|uniref:DNA repair protein RecO n=1 Tax=Bacterioplanes sanyensis TaxID=1249553 RepID=A0A222FKL1_9GAMM|nr:DNA repair protein RecO C-terminal domain-containing protein [Bacterioplanes sanyensis]ASP39202.1 hypothetical protein CHH28_11160 [Bacterioplanes sanyensis]
MRPFWLLQRQPWREHEWLVEVFSRDDGRLWLTADVRKQLDLHQLFVGDWQQQDGWPRLPMCHRQWHSSWSEQAFACGYYATELLSLLLPLQEPQPQLFDVYTETLKGLAAEDHPFPWLRLFEQTLLNSLGLGFSWQTDTQGDAIVKGTWYRFTAPAGWQPTERSPSAVCGSDLLQYAAGTDRADLWRLARNTLQSALQYHLPRPLISRCLLSSSTQEL